MKGYHRFVSGKLVIKVADSRVLSRSLFMSLTNYQTAFCFFSEVYYEAFTNICIISLFFLHVLFRSVLYAGLLSIPTPKQFFFSQRKT